MNIFIH